MDSDDDYQSLSPPKEASPQPPYRRLKRLKKSEPKPPKEPLAELIGDPLFLPHVDFARLEALEKDSEYPDFSELNSTEELDLSQESLSRGAEDENGTGDDDKMECGFSEEVKKTKRVLEFDDDAAGVEGGFGGGNEIAEGGEGFEQEKETDVTDAMDLLEEKKEKKKKNKKENAVKNDGSEATMKRSNKRREEKERRVYLEELHAESQKVLRETRNASFKPTPVVHKPISSVLEKIRKRKLEIFKRAVAVSDSNLPEGNNYSGDKLMELDLSTGCNDGQHVRVGVVNETVGPSMDGSCSATSDLDECKGFTKQTNQENDGNKEVCMELDASTDSNDGQHVRVGVVNETVGPSMDGSCLATSDLDECKGFTKQTNQENDENKESPEEEPTPVFRAPVHDTQDLFDDSEPNGTMAEPNDEQANNYLEEDIVPSLLPMNLKFDSAPIDDSENDLNSISSSSDEDNDKENVDPHPIGTADHGSSPKGDPVKDFVDDEAEEEVDSDNDPNCKGNPEDEDLEDFEELNDMIATGYEENLTDKERRNELHQKWLEQQDAAGTDKIMQRLGCGSELQDAVMSDKDSETDDEDEEFDDESREDSMPHNHTKMNIKKAKQMILQFLSEKEEDMYLSDDEDDKHRRHAQYVIRNGEQASIVPPANDENSREVFGLIKKLNIVPDQKKRPKPLSLFDSVLKGGNSNGSSKSSFLGRASNAPVPSSHRQGTGNARRFVFGRDDSNSRSSISASENSSDTISQETQHTKTISVKYCSSQMKFSNQTKNGSAAEATTKTSLLEILKRPSPQSQACNRDTTIDLTKSIFTFRASKRAMNPTGHK